MVPLRFLCRKKKYWGQYIQGLYERVSDNSNTQHRHYIQAGGRTIAIQTTASHQNAIHYLHKDHLGSSTTLTDELGDIVERSSYDVWGKRRNAQTWLADTPNAEEVRGYTGHEHLDDQNLIHMNGRVYDPTIARMLSVDPIVADTTNLQTWNRYSYVMNNSLRYIDPSGFGPESSSTETCQSEDGKPCEILVSVYHSSNGGGSFGYGYGTTGSQYWFGGGAANISQGAGGGGSANAQAGTGNDGGDVKTNDHNPNWVNAGFAVVQVGVGIISVAAGTADILAGGAICVFGASVSGGTSCGVGFVLAAGGVAVIGVGATVALNGLLQFGTAMDGTPRPNAGELIGRAMNGDTGERVGNGVNTMAELIDTIMTGTSIIKNGLRGTLDPVDTADVISDVGLGVGDEDDG